MDEICYCEDCAMEHRLPLGRTDLIGGFCGVCGIASGIIGSKPRDYFKERGIEVVQPKQ
jgi:hypothetical protein